MKQLYFVRHGRTEWNAIRRMQGQWNSNLDDVGREQARVNGQLMANVGVQALFASPLDRTRQTAEIINQRLNLPIAYDDRIMEWDCGDWSGHLYAEVEAKWATEWQAYRADPFYYRGPNCENYPDMIARSTPFLHQLREHPAERIGIVSHGMIGKVMVATLLGMNPEETLAFSQPNDRVFCVRLGGSADGSSEVSHFDGGDGPFDGLGGANTPPAARTYQA